jgi:lipopolysaccharide/colanic/teichoic acid biosynthesis glycosyltransferase
MSVINAYDRQNNLLLKDPIVATKRYLLIKRIFDLAVCIFILPPLLAVMAIVALVIKLDSPGPAIFIQERIGRGGKPYRMYKFRSMRFDHDDQADREFMNSYISGGAVQKQIPSSDQPAYKPDHKASITRVGKILRKTSLDEAPQIFNVLKGEMSIVGPRPNVPWEVEAYHWWHTERMEVIPGITGLAQVRGRSGLQFDTLVRYDIEYVRKRSMKLDMKILWWTVLTVLSGKGAG